MKAIVKGPAPKPLPLPPAGHPPLFPSLSTNFAKFPPVDEASQGKAQNVLEKGHDEARMDAAQQSARLKASQKRINGMEGMIEFRKQYSPTNWNHHSPGHWLDRVKETEDMIQGIDQRLARKKGMQKN